MYYCGKEITLKEYIKEQEKDYINKPLWMWKDEGIVWAIGEYFSSMGEFSEEDKATLAEYGFCEEDFIEEES